MNCGVYDCFGGLFCKLGKETNLNFIGRVVRRLVKGIDSIVASPGGRGVRMRVERAGAFIFLTVTGERSETGLFRAASVWVVADLVDEMDSDGLWLSTPDSFPIFPYEEPYNIQLSLMQHLYRAIEDRSVAVIESPTGTVNCLKVYQNSPTLTTSLQGKTASLLSATISWLLDDNERAKKGRFNHLAMDDRTFSPFPTSGRFHNHGS